MSCMIEYSEESRCIELLYCQAVGADVLFRWPY